MRLLFYYILSLQVTQNYCEKKIIKMFICDKFEEIWGKSLGKQVHESIIIIILLIKASSMGKYRINALFFINYSFCQTN